jgi:hypothetical protein
MRFVTRFVPTWVYKLSEAIQAGDMGLAREICIRASAEEPPEFDQDRPIDHAMRLAVAQADHNLAWLEEAEAFLATHAREDQIGEWQPGSVPHEAILAIRHLAGLIRLEDPPRAAAHFHAALALRPDFLPAKVELEILTSGRDRKHIFGALGVDAPRTDWGYMLAASELGMAPLTQGGRPPPGAICLRGLCTESTPALVRLYRWLNPTTPIIVATWPDTPPDILQAMSTWAHVVLAPPPKEAGSQNKNRQIVLARAALLTAKQAGISHVLLVRTDISLFKIDIIKNLHSVYCSFQAEPAAKAGRLIISDLFTRKFMGFHFSDLLAYGAVADLIRFWSAPMEVGDVYTHTEQYLGTHFYNSLELRVRDPGINDYHRLLRDFFVVRDFSWFEGCWLKQPELRDAKAQAFSDACISQLDWERLYHAPSALVPNAMGGADVGVVLQSALGIARL